MSRKGRAEKRISESWARDWRALALTQEKRIEKFGTTPGCVPSSHPPLVCLFSFFLHQAPGTRLARTGTNTGIHHRSRLSDSCEDGARHLAPRESC